MFSASISEDFFIEVLFLLATVLRLATDYFVEVDLAAKLLFMYDYVTTLLLVVALFSSVMIV